LRKDEKIKVLWTGHFFLSIYCSFWSSFAFH